MLLTYKFPRKVQASLCQNVSKAEHQTKIWGLFFVWNCHPTVSEGRKCPILSAEFADHCKSTAADARKETEWAPEILRDSVSLYTGRQEFQDEEYGNERTEVIYLSIYLSYRSCLNQTWTEERHFTFVFQSVHQYSPSVNQFVRLPVCLFA